MTPADIATALQNDFGPETITATKLDTLDPYVVVAPERIADVCRALRDDSRFKFEIINDITGTDWLETDAKKAAKAGFEPHLEVVYHISSFSYPGRRFTLKVILPRSRPDLPDSLPELPTVSTVWRGADWQEREIFDLLGIRFLGHPDLRRILMSDDWVGHPLRKDYEFPLDYHDIRCR